MELSQQLHEGRYPTLLSQGKGKGSGNGDGKGGGDGSGGRDVRVIKTVEMHTCGEVVRIVWSGWPDLSSSPLSEVDDGDQERTGGKVRTLLEQRELARRDKDVDAIRKRLMGEPRGWGEMYGAILIPTTEHTTTFSPAAHIATLFTHTTGYSTMCGHATIALGRFLVDLPSSSSSSSSSSPPFPSTSSSSSAIFPHRPSLPYNPSTRTVQIKLHAPCGVVDITVPTLDGGKRSDPNRAVGFRSVPCWVAGLGLSVRVRGRVGGAGSGREDEVGEEVEVKFDLAYGGAYYALIDIGQLSPLLPPQSASSNPNPNTNHHTTSLPALLPLIQSLKTAILHHPTIRQRLTHPTHHPSLSFLYGIIITYPSLGAVAEGTKGSEMGICFFGDEDADAADWQVDRSPTGSAVGARVAVKVARGELGVVGEDGRAAEGWTFHSLVSVAFNGNGDDSRSAKDGEGEQGFTGYAEEIVDVPGLDVDTESELLGKGKGVIVRTEGKAYYTGAASFVVEEGDSVGREGFLMGDLMV